MKKLLSILGAALLFFASPALAKTIPTLSANRPYQGDTLVVTLPRGASVASSTFDGEALQFFAYGAGERALVPIAPTATTGLHKIYIRFKTGDVYRRNITVLKKRFPLVVLGIPDNIQESPAEVVQQFGDINAELRSIVNVREPAALFSKTFRLPLAKFKRYGAPFGELRKTGDSLVRHLGTDFTAAAGTPVLAVNDGVVKLATSTSLYGNTVVIDHGAGIYSLYLHLSRIDTASGNSVKKGQKLGLVGQTGYAFGPHLHLSIKVNGVSVDPVRFIQSFR